MSSLLASFVFLSYSLSLYRWSLMLSIATRMSYTVSPLQYRASALHFLLFRYTEEGRHDIWESIAYIVSHPHCIKKAHQASAGALKTYITSHVIMISSVKGSPVWCIALSPWNELHLSTWTSTDTITLKEQKKNLSSRYLSWLPRSGPHGIKFLLADDDI